MRRVDVPFNTGNINRHSAEAPAAPIGFLRRHPTAAIPHPILPRHEGAVLAMLFEVGFGQLRPKPTPCFVEGLPRLTEGGR
jgi:hypothetical protein